MAYASTSTTMASPFEQMQRQAMEGLYGMGLTRGMSLREIRRKQPQMQRFGQQARGIFGGSMFSPQTQSMGFSDMTGFGSGSPTMPYSSTMMRGGEDRYRQMLTSAGISPSSAGLGRSSYSSASDWSSMGQIPRFPYSGMMNRY